MTVSRRMPAEWEKHRATWIAWPHNREDWHDKFETIPWVYAEITRALTRSEFVEIICSSESDRDEAKFCLDYHLVDPKKYRLHVQKTNRTWLRDSAPTAVFENGTAIKWIEWTFNAWAKYDDFIEDQNVPKLVSEISNHSNIKALRPDNKKNLVLEGGAIETDGEGTLIVTEECLQSDIQCRNKGLTKEGYEQAFKEYLGIDKTIWLVAGCSGDDTHGHIDDIARFTDTNKVLLAFEDDTNEEFHKISIENEKILKNTKNAKGESIQVTRLPMPRVIYFGDERLPASYANFYIANESIIVPTFNDKNDRVALNIIAEAFPKHEIIGISSIDLVLGFGTLHCLTQQEPKL